MRHFCHKTCIQVESTHSKHAQALASKDETLKPHCYVFGVKKQTYKPGTGGEFEVKEGQS